MAHRDILELGTDHSKQLLHGILEDENKNERTMLVYEYYVVPKDNIGYVMK